MARTTKRSRPAKGQYHHGDLRAAILDVASKMLREEGLESLSLRECARRVGVSHTAPYRHFTTREDLIAALAFQGFGWLKEAGVEAMAGLEDPTQRLHAYGVAYVRFAVEHPDRFRLMFGSATASSCAPEAASDAFALLRDCVSAVIGKKKDADSAALAFWTLPHGLAMLILDGRVPTALVSTRRALEKLALTCFAHWHG